MNRFLTSTALALALLFVPVALTTTGCKTTPNAQMTYKTIYAVAHGVDSAMLTWGEWVRAGKTSVESQNKVRSLYQKYQVIAQKAIAKDRTMDAEAPIELVDAAGTLTTTVGGLTR
jgi:hypothetical protein